MATPKVNTNSLNLGQGSTPDIEKKTLFIGVADGSAINSVVYLSSGSDLDDLMGAADSRLKSQVKAAVLSAGTGFEAAYIEITAFAEWPAALEKAMETFSMEMVVVCEPITAQVDLTDAQVVAQNQINTLSRLVDIFMETPVITGLQSWSDYVTTQALLTDGVVCDRVIPVPNLNGNNLGALVGRLMKNEVSIADSPIRILTGADISLGQFAVDKDGKAITLATLTALHNQRLTVPFWFSDVEGTYWTDCLTLDKTGGDYQLIENRRVVDKAARAIRILTINQIGNREFNKTELSTKFYESFLAKPLRQMAIDTTINKKRIPGEIQKPKADAITIQWTDSDSVNIFYKVTPFHSPKEITNNVFLDLSSSQ